MRGETRKVKLEVGKKAGRRWRHKVSATKNRYEERARCIVPLRVMVEGRRIHSEVKWQKVGGSTVRLNGGREEVSSPVYPVARG